MKRHHWVEIISSLFILLFVYTAVNKFMEFERFRNVLHGSPLLGRISSVIAWLVPISELIISSLLFFPKTRKLGLWGSLLIMAIFTGYITYMLYFSDVRPCSCGGVIEKMTWNQHLIFNIFFTALAGLGLWVNKGQNKRFDLPLQFSSSR